MKRNTGFSLIELLITITIMVVLITLTVTSLRSNEISARDTKRKTDVVTIAQQLENFYRSGSNDPTATLSHTDQYPSTAFMSSESKIKAALPDIDPKSLRAPNVGDSSPISLVVATSNTAPSPDISTYVYQPLKSDGSLCQLATDECRKFNLFYQQESDSSIQEITSKHQ